MASAGLEQSLTDSTTLGHVEAMSNRSAGTAHGQNRSTLEEGDSVAWQ